MTKRDLIHAVATLSRRAAIWTHDLTCIDERGLDEHMPADRLRRIHESLELEFTADGARRE